VSAAPPLGLRILVGAGSFADATAALHLVQYLQGNFCAGLGGILIEDADMLATCEIPDQRIVLPSGTTAQAPNPSKVRTLFKADARAFRNLLAHTAGSRKTDWAFIQDKGELVTTALRVARDWDVLILGYCQLHNVPGKIVLLQSSGPSSDAMTQASRMLAKYIPNALTTFTVDKNTHVSPTASASNAFQFDTLPEALATLTRTNAQAVLVDLKRSPLSDHNDLLRLLEVARCPVIVFGTSNLPALLEHNTHIPPKP
jgi:hypothetical protein